MPPQHTSTNEWKPWKLARWWISILVVLIVGIIASIVALERISAKYDGIRSVRPSAPLPFFRFPLQVSTLTYGLLWTSLPAFIVSIYSLLWGTIVSATADRQPFVELGRPAAKATNARRTIMLDYRSYAAFYSWERACRYRHPHLFLGMLLNLVLVNILVPLSSHIFVSSIVILSRPTTVNFTKVYNASALSGREDIQSAFSIATATRTFGGTPPAWMTTEYSFEPFSYPFIPSGNVSTVLTGFSANLSCLVLSSDQYLATGSNSSVVSFNFTDRDCAVDPIEIPVSSGKELFVKSWSFNDCSVDANYSRFGIVSGSYSNDTSDPFSELSVVSCIPNYWRTVGTLTIAAGPNDQSNYVSFDPQTKNVTSSRPDSGDTMERNLPNYGAIDPTGTFYGNNFGVCVYQQAAVLSPSDPLNSTAVRNAVEDIFTTIYASVATTWLFQTPDTAGFTAPTPMAATYFVEDTRLFVVTVIAYIVVGVLVAVLLCTILLWIYAERHHSILQGEEPVGLLGMASVLEKSEIMNFVAKFHAENPGELKMRDNVKEKYSWKTSRCFYDEAEQCIRVVGLKDKTATSAQAASTTPTSGPSGSTPAAQSQVTSSTVAQAPMVQTRPSSSQVAQPPPVQSQQAPASAASAQPAQSPSAHPPLPQPYAANSDPGSTPVTQTQSRSNLRANTPSPPMPASNRP